MEHAETAGTVDRPGSSGPSASRVAGWAIGAGLLAGIAAGLAGEATVQAFRPPIIRMNTPLGPMTGSTAADQTRADVNNATLAFVVQGACLGLVLGLAGGLSRRSATAGVAAGLVGMVFGGGLAFGASAALQPVYYRNIQLDQVEQGMIWPLLVHGGIWGLAGLVGGAAFGLGLGGGGASIGRAAVGGLVGALLAALLYEATAAMAFPEAGTTRPLSLSTGSRLMARMLVALLSGAGIAALAASTAPATATTTAPADPPVAPPSS